MNQRLWKLWTLLFAFSAYILCTGMICGRAAQVSVQVQQPFTFKLSVAEALSKEGIQPVDGKVPPGINKTITVSYEDELDLRDRQELSKYKERVQAVHINRVWFRVDRNTANVVVPPANVFVQALTSKDKSTSVASFPALTPGKNDQTGDLLWNATGLENTRKVLEGFGMKLKLSSTIQVKSGTEFPKGFIELKVILDVTYTLSLL